MNNGQNSMRVLVFGAGVLGSVYAARLQDASHHVTVVARGQRYHDIREHGIVVEYFDTRERTTTKLDVVDRMPVDQHYDFCLVAVQKTQLAGALPALAENPHIPAFLFMVNTTEGPQAMIDALGRDRVLLGFANMGGERDGHIVKVMIAKGKPITVGELDGSRSERLRRIASAFADAGIGVDISPNMYAWLKYHVALVGPLANALYMAGSCNYKLARNRRIVKKGLQGMREAMGVMRAHRIPVEPRHLRVMQYLPYFILVPLAQRLFATELLDIGGSRHARNARNEMTQLNEELLALASSAGLAIPVLRELYRYSDPSVPPEIEMCPLKGVD